MRYIHVEYMCKQVEHGAIAYLIDECCLHADHILLHQNQNQIVSDQITLHLFQPHQADQMLTLLTQEGSSFLSTC